MGQTRGPQPGCDGPAKVLGEPVVLPLKLRFGFPSPSYSTKGYSYSLVFVAFE
jgi:hypothetical protein